MTEIPASFYYMVGSLILANLGTIGSLLLFGGKALWWLAKLETRVEKAQDTAVRAHKRIDNVENNKFSEESED